MSIFSHMRAALTRTGKTPENAYLNAATSQVDLEMRQREVDRGRLVARRPYY